MIYFIGIIACCFFSGCEDEWGNDNKEMEHIYYYGLGNVEYPGGNELQYDVKQGETISVPTYFFSAFKRSYNPVVSYYTIPVPDANPQLIRGIDYEVVDQKGNVLTPDSENDGFSMIWPNAAQGVQNVYIKALHGQKGSIRILTFDPSRIIDATDVSSTIIVTTSEYEVRAFSENYYVTVNIK